MDIDRVVSAISSVSLYVPAATWMAVPFGRAPLATALIADWMLG